MRPCRASHSLGIHALGVVFALILSGTLHAQPAQPLRDARAQAQFDEALKLYQAKDFAAAATQIEAAFAIEPRPDLLYMWAQSRRLAGDCAGAADLYRRFIATGPPATELDRARKNLERCEASPAAAAPAPPPALPTPSPIVHAPPVVPPPAPVAPPAPIAIAASPTLPAPAARRPWHGDTLGHVLVGSGIGTGAAGFGLYQWARAAQDTAINAGRYQDVDRASKQVELRQRLAFGAAALGTSLIIAGLVRYLIH